MVLSYPIGSLSLNEQAANPQSSKSVICIHALTKLFHMLEPFLLMFHLWYTCHLIENNQTFQIYFLVHAILHVFEVGDIMVLFNYWWQMDTAEIYIKCSKWYHWSMDSVHSAITGMMARAFPSFHPIFGNDKTACQMWHSCGENMKPSMNKKILQFHYCMYISYNSTCLHQMAIELCLL